MNKITVSARLPSLMVEKVQQAADKHHSGDRTAALINLLTLGLEAYDEGKDIIPPKYELPEEIILAIEAEVREKMRLHREMVKFEMKGLETKLSKKLKNFFR